MRIHCTCAVFIISTFNPHTKCAYNMTTQAKFGALVEKNKCHIHFIDIFMNDSQGNYVALIFSNSNIPRSLPDLHISSSTRI